jgi:hypothetical protein
VAEAAPEFGSGRANFDTLICCEEGSKANFFNKN